MLFKKEALSEKFNLEKILIDVENITNANPNAALSQLRTFIEVYCNATLTYEGVETNADLSSKINEIKRLNLLNNEEIELLHQIRKKGNDAVHTYYYCKEDALAYLQICENIYSKFINKYEKEKITYKKKILKNYLNNINRNIYDEENNEFGDNKNKYNGELILEDSMVVPNEDIDLNSLYDYSLLKNRLINYFDSLNKIIKEMNLCDIGINEARERLNKNNFNLVVLGEFNRGKSTFLNSLLGECLLPSDVLPTTATITRINYDNNKRCEVTYENGDKETISIEKITEYATNSKIKLNNKIKMLDIYYPLELCKNNCTIIDTPGVNDLNEQNVIITERYIPEADAIIFLMDCTQAFTESEKIFIKTKILKNDIKKIFFIINKVDSINNKSIDSFKIYIENAIKEMNIDCKIYYLSSKRSLLCKIKETTDEYLANFNIFTQELENFLVRDKGRYLLINSCRRISEFSDNISSDIYKIENDMKSSIEVLEKKLIEFKNIEKSIQNNKIKIFNKIDKKYNEFKNEISSIISKELTLSFDKFINNLKLNKDDGIINYNDIEIEINNDIDRWLNNRIVPFVMMNLNNINDDLYKILIESIKCIDDFENKSNFPVVKQMKIVQSTRFEMPTSYNNECNKENETMFVGVGAILAVVVTGTLLSGIGGAILGSILYSAFNNDYKDTINETNINNRIIEEKDKLVKKIVKNINDAIEENYDTNCKFVNNYIENALKSNSLRLNTVLNKRKDKNMDFQLIKPQLNNYLNKIFLIKKKVNLLSGLLKEIKYE